MKLSCSQTTRSTPAFAMGFSFIKTVSKSEEWQDVEFAKEWINERDEYLSKKFTN